MRIVVIGGTRFIGRAAVVHAVGRGHEVTLLHRGAHAADLAELAHARVREAIVDRADPSALAKAVALAKPDVVIDTRAMQKVDAEATALAAKIARVPVVVLSSQDVYAGWEPFLGHDGPPPSGPLSEASPLTRVRFPYRGKSHDGGEDYDKKDVEAVFRDAVDLPAVCVLRLPAVYGRRDYRRRFGAIVDALDAGHPIPCAGGARFRWTHAHVRDVAHAIVLAAEKTPRATYNVGERETPTMHERVVAIAAAAGRPLVWRETGELPEAFAVLGAQPGDLVVRSDRIRDELGWDEITTEAERYADVVAAARESRAAWS